MMFKTNLCAILILGMGALHGKDCENIGLKVHKAVNADPAQVLLIVEDYIVTHEICACEIIGGAIGGVSEDPQLVEEIVFTGVSAAPGMGATIMECALAAAPKAKANVKRGMKRALTGEAAGTAVRSSKNPGKNPPYVKNPPPDEPLGEDIADFGKTPVDIRGIYLIPPVSQAGGLDPAELARILEGREIIVKIIEKPGRIRSVTPSNPGSSSP